MLTTSTWLDQFFAFYYRSHPVNATFVGVHAFDHELPDYSDVGVAEAVSQARGLLDLLDTGQVTAPASAWEGIDRLLARNFLMTRIWELTDARVHLENPCVYTGEAVFGVISLFLRDFAPLENRVAAATERLRAIPKLLEQGLTQLSSSPRAWIERGMSECDGAIAFLDVGVAILRERHGVDSPAFFAAARVAGDAFGAFRRALEERLLPNSHDSYGCGAEQFDQLLRLAHCLDMTGADVEVYAQRRLAEARNDLRLAATAYGPGRTPAETLAQLTEIHPTLADYYPAYQREFDAAQAFAVDHHLVTWPDYPIIFEPIPDWARAAQPFLYFLFYRAPAPFDAHVVQRYLVTPIDADMPADEQQRRLRATNTSQIRLNHVIHHGGIGHHVQNWWAYRAESRAGRMAAVDCALRIAMLAGGTMAEGWACYATDLMAEQGYLTPLEQMAEHQGLARMAARAIVDVRLHSGQFSFDEAVAFYRDDIGMSEAASRAETIKNSMFPGGAMMYLIGTDAIHGLRSEMESAWGDTFSLQRFHDTFLSHGSIPVALTAKLMRGEAITDEGYVSPA